MIYLDPKRKSHARAIYCLAEDDCSPAYRKQLRRMVCKLVGVKMQGLDAYFESNIPSSNRKDVEEE